MKINSSLPGLAFFVLGLACLSEAQAMQCRHGEPPGRPAIGLALGGGGARGFAHIGVLQMLEEMRVPYDYIAGTSMGSLVGGMAAVGMDSGEILKVVEAANWTDLFTDRTERQERPARRKEDDVLGLYGPKLGIGKDSTLLPSGFVTGQKILFLFETVTSQRAQASHFDHLPVPFRAVATDIVTGRMVVKEDGALSEAMRASMAVPGAFDPVHSGDQVLVDGGLVRNLPVDVVRDMGADVVIAVDVGTPLAKGEDIRNVIHIVEQMSSLLIVQNTEQQVLGMSDEDLLIRPDLGKGITSASFEKFAEAIPIGYQAAESIRERLSAFSVSESEYGTWRESIRRCVTGPPKIQFVRLDNQSRFADTVIEDLITVEPGDTLDVAELDRNLRQIYGLGFIHIARYEVVEEKGNTGIEILVQQDERGTDFLETGLTLAGSGRGTTINLQAGYLKTDLDPRGSELRTTVQVGDDFGLLADVYKYLDDRQRYIFNPYVALLRNDLVIFDELGRASLVTQIDEAALTLALGREFGRSMFLSLGVSRYLGTVDITIGQPRGKFHYNGGEYQLGAMWDRLDDLYLPTRGTRLEFDYTVSRDELGADEEFEQIRTSLLHSQTWGYHNLLLAAKYNSTLDDDAPVYALFTGGGFLNMSGFEPNELVGQHFGFVGAGYRYQLVQSGFLPGYIGGCIEYGYAAD